MSGTTDGEPTQEMEARAARRPDTSALTDKQLARLVLARQLRPRVGEIRRLAEAVVAGGKAKRPKKDKGGKPSRKLAKIPGQKKKKHT